MNFLKDTRKLIFVAILAAVASVLAFIEIPYPIPPASLWLRFDVSEVPVLVAASTLGFLPMVTVAFIRSFVRLMSGWNTSSTVFGLAEGIAFVSSLTIGTSFYLAKKFVSQNFLKRNLVINPETGKSELVLTKKEELVLNIVKKIIFYSILVLSLITINYIIAEVFTIQPYDFDHFNNFSINYTLRYFIVSLLILALLTMIILYFNRNKYKVIDIENTQIDKKYKRLIIILVRIVMLTSLVIIGFFTITSIVSDAIPIHLFKWAQDGFSLNIGGREILATYTKFDWSKTIKFKLGFTPGNLILFLIIVLATVIIYHFLNKDSKKGKISLYISIGIISIISVLLLHVLIAPNFDINSYYLYDKAKGTFKELTFVYRHVYQFLLYLLTIVLASYFILVVLLNTQWKQSKYLIGLLTIASSSYLLILLAIINQLNEVKLFTISLNFLRYLEPVISMKSIFWVSLILYIVSLLAYLSIKYVKSTSDFIIAMIVVLSLTTVLTLLNFFITTPANLTAGQHWFFTTFVKDESINSAWGGGSTASYAAIIIGIYVPFNIIKGIFVMAVYYNIRRLEPTFDESKI